MLLVFSFTSKFAHDAQSQKPKAFENRSELVYVMICISDASRKEIKNFDSKMKWTFLCGMSLCNQATVDVRGRAVIQEFGRNGYFFFFFFF